jgi:uncharacterized protein
MKRFTSVRNLVITLIAFGLGLQFFDARAQATLRPLPPMLHAISDEVEALSEPEGRSLAKTVSDIQRETGVRIMVVIVGTTQPESMESYSHRLLIHWGTNRPPPLGVEDIIIVLAVEDRTLRIAAGIGMAPIVKEVSNNNLMSDVGLLFRNSKYFSAVEIILERLSQATNKNK